MSFNPTQVTDTFKVTGVDTKVDGNPGTRVELRTLAADKTLWDLFLMGLWALQKVPQYRDKSFYRIAGIHGKPYVPWPPRDSKIIEGMKVLKGFCTHTSILFLPWHRPYIALYEQMIYEGIKYVVSMGTEQESKEWKKRMHEFRLPFWDWAQAGLDVFPTQLTEETVKVPMPKAMRAEYNVEGNDTDVTIKNPLYRYEFGHDTAAEVILLKSKYTERYGKDVMEKDSTKGYVEQTAEQRKAAIDKSMTPYSREVNADIRPEGNLRERVVYLVQSYKTFATVSHNQWDPTRVPFQPGKEPFPGASPLQWGQGFGSIEDIHNTVHGLVGGGGADADGVRYNGHMSQVEVASFDPVFWLHHCNIDRVFSLWDALHYDSANKDTYVTPYPAAEESWTKKIGDGEGIDSPLVPFYKEAGKFWTPADVRLSSNLNYVYPETQAWKWKNDVAGYRLDIAQRLNTLYPNASLATIMTQYWHGTQSGKDSEDRLKLRAQRLKAVTEAKGPTDTASATAVLKDDSKLPALDSKKNLKALASDATYWEYMFNIKAEKHAFNGKYSVHCFIGPVEEDATTLYAVSPNHVGSFTPFGQSAETKCGNCQEQMKKKEEITSQIPLTIALVERYFAGFLDDLEPATVINYLQTELHWEVLDDLGNRLTKQRDKLAGLKVSVSSNEVTIDQKDPNALAKYADTVSYLYAITTDPKTGLGRGEGTGLTMRDLYSADQLKKGEGVVVQSSGKEAEGS